MVFRDRTEAGTALAQRLLDRPVPITDALVLALPRGGVPVAAPIADALGAPLDVLVVRKLGVPRQAELAMGAIAGVGADVVVVENERVLGRSRVAAAAFAEVRKREAVELRRRERAYRGDRVAPAVTRRTVVLVDDGLATGSTMRAAVAAVRTRDPCRIVVAVPVGARRTCAELAHSVDEVVCPLQPSPFTAVAQGYADFAQVEDAEVRRLLASYTGTSAKQAGSTSAVCWVKVHSRPSRSRTL